MAGKHEAASAVTTIQAQTAASVLKSFGFTWKSRLAIRRLPASATATPARGHDKADAVPNDM